MIQRLNKIIKNNPLSKTLKSSSGQVAVILILVIASALIFFAVTLNFSRLGQIKALVTAATDSSAGQLGSSMASYGQALSETSLDGGNKICGWTGVFAAILTVVVVIIAIVLSYFSGPPTGMAIMQWWMLMAASFVMAIGSVVVQMAVVNPGLSEAWNSQIQKTLSMRNQFTESAIQSALSKVATDPVRVPDMNDLNRNRVWGIGAGGVPNDTLARYSVYYNKRIEGIKEGDVLTFQAFFVALKDFLYITAPPPPAPPDWGIYDPYLTGCVGSAECDFCCVPARRVIVPGVIPAEDITENRPLECENSTDDAVWGPSCASRSPYSTAYPWLYTPATDDPNNALFSFRELLGRDDQHQLFKKDSANPNGFQIKTSPSPSPLLPPTNFLLEDTTRFYVPPAYSPGIENREGIFPFFYKMADWGVDLSTLNLASNPLDCHWCDPRDTTGNCIPCNGAGSFPLEIPQLVLPLDPGNPADGLLYNISYAVDGIGNPFDVPSNPPLAVDKVDLPSNIIAADTVCAQSALYPVDTGAGFWKRGDDRFCSDVYPYQFECGKHGSCTGDDGLPTDCTCGLGSALPENFPEDVLDDLIHGLADFVEWAENFLLQEAIDPQQFANDFTSWYQDVAEWIEPPSPPADRTTDPPCFVCGETGYLYIWLAEIEAIRDRIQDWIVNHNDALDFDEGYAGAGPACTEVWCVPSGPNVVCPEVPADEFATFDGNINGVQGDVADIVGCLNYNVEGYDYAAGVGLRNCLNSCSVANCEPAVTLPEFQLDGVTLYVYPAMPIDLILDCGAWAPGNLWYDDIMRNLALAVNADGTNQGNNVRFWRCGQTCSLRDCFSLPRSLVPHAAPPFYDPNAYQPVDPLTADGNWLDLKDFENCRRQCNAKNCKVGQRLPIVHTADLTPYPYPVVPFDEAIHCVGGVLTPTLPGPAPNPWYYAIVANENSIKPPNEADARAFLNCLKSCSVANCSVMPVVHSGDGITPYVWNGSGGGPPPPVTPADFVAGDCVGWAPGNPWYDDIVVNLRDAGGPSCDLDPNGWLDQTRQSAIEAHNQVAKFKKRRDFLALRLAEAERMITILDNAATAFRTFLEGEAADLIRKRINHVDDGIESGLPYQAIYGWQSPLPPDAAPGSRGKWHIVKTEARLPGMCDTACGTSQARGSDPGWPRIRSYTKSWGTKRCYELADTSGVVKFRTVRYDEEKISNLLTFPNAVPIWNFRSSHPDRPQTGAYDPTNLSFDCASSTIKTLPDGMPTTIYDGAFILTWYLHSTDFLVDNVDCWERAHKLLTRGVVSETCAEYYWHGGTNPGMGFKFISCREF